MFITNQISFKSRNYEIRRADNIARNVAKKFPMVSSSKLCICTNALFFTNILNNLHKKLVKTRIEGIRALNPYSIDTNPKEKILNFLKIMKRDKLGNCAEMVDIATVFTYLRGIKNTGIAYLTDKSGNDLDHVVLYVENRKKPYIIDPWLGFADYISNAKQKYKSEFSYIFSNEPVPPKDICFNKDKILNSAKRNIDNCSYTDLMEIKTAIYSD